MNKFYFGLHDENTLPHTASTYPFQYNFDVVVLWMVEDFVYARLNRCLIAQVLPHAMLTGLSVQFIN